MPVVRVPGGLAMGALEVVWAVWCGCRGRSDLTQAGADSCCVFQTGPAQRGDFHLLRGAVPPSPAPQPPTRRVVTVPASFRKCPHCPTIFMDVAQLAAHLAAQHRDQQRERDCQRCRRRFLTYEDNTACDPCLMTLRQSALPSRKGSGAAAGSAAAECVCGHCRQTFPSRVLAELHCLSTGHDLAQIGSAEEMKVKEEGSSRVAGNAGATGKAKEEPRGAGAPPPSASEARKWAGKAKASRKRRLTRRNQTTCEVCAKECGSVSSLYTHLRTAHPAMFPYECGVCGRRFSLEASARDHERRHAVGELQCPACPLRFTRMSHLHHHARQLHPDFTEYPCQYCGAVTPTVDALHSHIKVHHGDRLGLPADFTCEVCKESFHTGKALATHRSSRHPGTAECGFCGAHVGSRYLKKHINAVHTKEKTHRCHECGQDFYSRTSLTGHHKRHHAPRKHLCEQCGKGYVNNVELQRHLKAHRNQRDFKCDVCGRSFLKAVDLTYHRRSHTGERPHQCMLCQESFIRPLGLRKHMLKHTAARKGKRLKYSKKKIDELTSSVICHDASPQEAEAHTPADVGGLGAGEVAPGSDQPPQHAPPSDLPQTLQVFPSPSSLAASSLAQPQPRLQTTLQQLTPSTLQVQQLAVTDLDGSQLEGQLELSQVVEDLSSGELLGMGPDLLLEATDVRGDDDVEGAMGEGGHGKRAAGEQAAQPVQVIYVQFVEDATGWRPEQQLQPLP
ncbi:hypothetical protein C7M84_020028 [Penaeus vannamei]|uniref:C2H2-type domain-containing protein n=1 Tax=Penaeus vannamei TaxID=6689 RepID=A0A423SD96_PENVA|nr:hypothetical protein C7M84_020028 [Penaeus vannamei]